MGNQDIICFKGALVPVSDAKVGVMTRGLSDGTGYSEGIRTALKEAGEPDALRMIDGRLCALSGVMHGGLERGRHWCAPVCAAAISHAGH